MDFGRVPENELNKLDFTLPAEPGINKLILKGKKAKDIQIYIGCAKWGRKEWIGKIYPKGTKEANFLSHYVNNYNSIELNATHYKIYGPSFIANWAAKANNHDFKFC